MSTKLMLRNTQRNDIGAAYFDMITAAGSSLTTGVVNTTSGGTEIQWTQTAGGTLIQCVSGEVPSGGFTLSGLMTFNIWALESNNLANCGARVRVYKRTLAGIETEVTGGPWDKGAEFGTAAAVQNWTGTPTIGVAFLAGDRLLVKYFITNIGTMGSGRTCTIDFNGGTGGSDVGSYLQINETIAFLAEPNSGLLMLGVGF